VTELFEKDSRWEPVEATARKELYDDFKLELVKREKERKRAARKEKAAAFRKVSVRVRVRLGVRVRANARAKARFRSLVREGDVRRP